MDAAKLLHSDRWGDILDRPEDGCVEIRWNDETAEMSGDDFNGFLEIYAGFVERCRRPGGLIDALQFKMDMSLMNPGWRDQNIIPRYNAAGLAKFAFIMPKGMPAIGAVPAPEGPADFPTAYFASRADALAWLKA